MEGYGQKRCKPNNKYFAKQINAESLTVLLGMKYILFGHQKQVQAWVLIARQSAPTQWWSLAKPVTHMMYFRNPCWSATLCWSALTPNRTSASVVAAQMTGRP
jgi:hypothetical protein